MDIKAKKEEDYINSVCYTHASLNKLLELLVDGLDPTFWLRNAVVRIVGLTNTGLNGVIYSILADALILEA